MKEENCQSAKAGVYRHNKNKKDYQVLFFGYDSETKGDVIVYKSLDDGKIWVRPKKMFFEKIEINGQYIPRFELIKEPEEINEDKEKFEDKYKRALADYHNLAKQTAKEKSDFAKFANEQMLFQLLPVYDNLKMAIMHANKDNHDSWLEGVKHVAKQFKDALESNGVEEIKTKGEKFDHNTMEAMTNEETDDKKKDGLVAREIKPGYKLNGKVVIAARVVVYKIKN